MELEITEKGIRIRPENVQDQAYIRSVLKLRKRRFDSACVLRGPSQRRPQLHYRPDGGKVLKEETREMSGGEIDIEQKRREVARWAVLRILDAGRPIGVNGAVVLRILAEQKLLFLASELRREFGYLRELGLIEVEDEESHEFFAGRLTSAGVNIVEYAAPAPAGVARPRKSIGAA